MRNIPETVFRILPVGYFPHSAFRILPLPAQELLRNRQRNWLGQIMRGQSRLPSRNYRPNRGKNGREKENVRNVHPSLSLLFSRALVNRRKSRSREHEKIFCRAIDAFDSKPGWTRNGGKEKTLTLGANLRCI